MFVQQKIAIAKVRLAYGLNDYEVERLLAAMWPQYVSPLGLWRDAYEKIWSGFAVGKASLYRLDNPSFPETDVAKEKYFFPHIHALDVLDFFSKLTPLIQVNAVREGLKYIFAVTYENDIDETLQEEVSFLINRLSLVEKNADWQYSKFIPADEFISLMQEKVLSVPPTSYGFITRIFPDTILVDTVAAIRQLHAFHYPLRREVKGIDRDLVHSVTNAPAQESPDVSETVAAPAETAAETQPQDQKPIIRVPASLWEGRPGAAVRDAMKADYRLSIIAYVLLNWCEVSKTQVGRVLSEREYKENKSYRNFVDDLLKEAAAYTIIKS